MGSLTVAQCVLRGSSRQDKATLAGATPLLLAAGRGQLATLLACAGAEAGKKVRNPFYGRKKLDWHLVPFFPRDAPLPSLKPPPPAAPAAEAEAGSEEQDDEGGEEKVADMEAPAGEGKAGYPAEKVM